MERMFFVLGANGRSVDISATWINTASRPAEAYFN